MSRSRSQRPSIFSSVLPVLGTTILFSMMVFVVGCGPAKQGARKEKMVPTGGTSEIRATGPIVANDVETLAVTVVIRDQSGAAMAGLIPVLSVSGSGNSVSGCSPTTATGESFCTVTSTKAEEKSLNLTAPLTLAGPSVIFTAGPATKLGFVSQPSDSTENQIIVTQPSVEVRDAFENRVTTATQNITLALKAPSTGALSGTASLAALAGLATFTDIAVTTDGPKVLEATALGLTSATSASFVVYDASGKVLSFRTQPGGGDAGAAWTPQPVVEILLVAAGAVDTSANFPVTLTLTSGTGIVVGTLTVNAVSGVATFTGLTMDAVGSKVVTATSPGLANAVANSFTIVPAAPSAISFSTQPGGGAVNTAWTPQPVVRLVDAYGNLCTNSSASVALSLQAGTGAISGTMTVAAASGVATFTGLKTNVAGQKVLRAAVNALTVDSTTFTVGSGSAAVLKFTSQPSEATAGQVWTSQPVIEARDAYDNKATSFTGSVTLALTAGSGSVTGGLLTATAASGVATFSGLRMVKAGGDKVLSATASGLTAGTTAIFSVAHSSPYELVVTAAPSEDLANTTLVTQPQLELRDEFGNIITTGVEGTAPIAVSLSSGSGALTGATGMVAVSGVVQFANLKLTTPGMKVLRFTKPNLSGFGGTASLFVNSNSFEARIGSPAKLAFETETTGGTVGINWLIPPAVEILDTAGNRVVSSSGTVSLSLGAGTGPLIGTTSVVASSGLVQFSGLRMNISGPKQLLAQSMGLTAATSASFAVMHGAPVGLGLKRMPIGGVYTAVFPTQPIVAVQDIYGNTVETGPDATATIAATLQSGSGAPTGTTSLTAVSGVVTYTNLKIPTVGPKVLRFTKSDTTASDGTTSKFVDSTSFDISAGPATKLVIVTAPTGAVAGLSFISQPVIEIQDAGNNRVSTNPVVTVAMTAGTGSLLGTLTAVASSGVSTFTNLSYNIAGAKTLRFSSGALATATAPVFMVAPSLAISMNMVTAPSGTPVDSLLNPAPKVEILDLYGNRVVSGIDSTANITASLFNGTGQLTGTLTLAAGTGLATFSNMQIDAVGSKILRFTKADTSGSGGASTLTVNTPAFAITSGLASMLDFSLQPGGGTAGIVWSQQPIVRILDNSGNVVTSSSAAVNLSLSMGSGPLVGTASVAASSGIATFTGLNIEAMGTGKVLTATSAGLTDASSNSFSVVAGVASASASSLAATPLNVWADGTDLATVTVQVTDAYGNPAMNRTVILASSRGASDTIVGSPATSDTNGEVTFSVRSSTSGSSTLTASVSQGGVSINDTESITFMDATVSPSNSTWTQDRVSVIDDASAGVTFSGVFRNASGVALPGRAVQLTSSRGGDTITASTSVTASGGEFSFTVKSLAEGSSALTLSESTTPILVTNLGRAQFLAATPYSEWVAALASKDAYKMYAGQNSPAVGSWRDVASTADGTLNNFAYNTSTSGWMGDGGTVISGGTSGPYRLGFDGTDDFVNFGTSFNSLTAMSIEAWARPFGMVSSAGGVVAGNSNGTSGLMIRASRDKLARWEASLGKIYSDQVLEDSPVAYFRMSELSGTTAVSSAGTMATRPYIGGVTVNQTGALNSNNASALFNGTTGYMNFGNSFITTGAQGLTVEGWVKLSTAVVTLSRTIVGKQNASSGIALEVNTSQYPTFTAFSGTTAVTAIGTTALTVGVWYHVVGVRDIANGCAGAGRSIAIYVNGVREACSNLASASGNYTANLFIGNNPGGTTRWFPGNIDEVALYTSTLSDGRIQAHYDSRLAPTCYSAAAVSDNAWSHVIAGFDNSSSTMKMQVNGTESCNLTASGYTVNGSGVRLAAGAQLNGGGGAIAGTYWRGALSQVRVYNKGISATEASTNYSALSSQHP